MKPMQPKQKTPKPPETAKVVYLPYVPTPEKEAAYRRGLEILSDLIDEVELEKQDKEVS